MPLKNDVSFSFSFFKVIRLHPRGYNILIEVIKIFTIYVNCVCESRRKKNYKINISSYLLRKY